MVDVDTGSDEAQQLKLYHGAQVLEDERYNTVRLAHHVNTDVRSPLSQPSSVTEQRGSADMDRRSTSCATAGTIDVHTQHAVGRLGRRKPRELATASR